MPPFFAEFICLILISAVANGSYDPLVGQQDCAGQCDFHQTQKDYEECIKRCTGTFDFDVSSASDGSGSQQNASLFLDVFFSFTASTFAFSSISNAAYQSSSSN